MARIFSTAPGVEAHSASSAVSRQSNGRPCFYSQSFSQQLLRGKGLLKRSLGLSISSPPRLAGVLVVAARAGGTTESYGYRGYGTDGTEERKERFRYKGPIESRFGRDYRSTDRDDDPGRSRRRGPGDGGDYRDREDLPPRRGYDMDADGADRQPSSRYGTQTRQGDSDSYNTRQAPAYEYQRRDFDEVPGRERPYPRPERESRRMDGDLPVRRDRQVPYQGEADNDGDRRRRPSTVAREDDDIDEPRSFRRGGYDARSPPPGGPRRSFGGYGSGGYGSDRRPQERAKSAPRPVTQAATPQLPLDVDVFSRLGTDASFRDLGLSPVMVRALAAYGCASPTEIQARSIPWVLAGHSCAILAETGSGKTFSYALPLCQRLQRQPPAFPPEQAGRARPRRGPGTRQDDPPPTQPRALVLVPSGHLAYQAAHFVRLAAEMCSNEEEDDEPMVVDVLSKQKKGGAPPGPIGVLVATPGRVVSDVEAQTLSLASLETLVLDEADELLSDGFLPVLTRILKMASRLKGTKATKLSAGTLQVLFVGATLGRELWDSRVKELFPGKLRRIASDRLHRVPDRLECKTLVAPSDDAAAKNGMLLSLLTTEHRGKRTLVFTKDPDECAQVFAFLREQGVHTCGQYSGRASSAAVLEEFMQGVLDVLVCTDIGARGLDFPNVEHVVQYTLAPTVQLYLHRVGRAARTGQQRVCYATALVDVFRDDKDLLTQIHFDPQAFNGKALIETRASPDAWEQTPRAG